MTLRHETPSEADAPNPAMTSPFLTGYQWREVADLQHWAAEW
ncbi:MAG TPA: hypothetical protein VIW67_22240 [Terriglobales bacterium]